jgi:hypothetical protein
MSSILNHTEFLKELEEKEQDYGMIYCITNTVNEKKYYGQTKCYRETHGKIVKNSIEKRFKEHIKHVQKNKSMQHKLYNDIREYGSEVFKCELVTKCQLKYLDAYEKFYIVTENAIINGYNTMTSNFVKYDEKSRIDHIKSTMKDKWDNNVEYADKTKKANLVAVKKRAEEGTTRMDKNKGLPNNIYRNKKDGGYDIRIMRNGMYKITSVTGKDKSDAELLELAIAKRDLLMRQMEVDGKVDRFKKKLDHNGNEIPKGILKYSIRNMSGYRVSVIINGKRAEKSFLDGKNTMDERLEMAKEALKKLTGN